MAKDRAQNAIEQRAQSLDIAARHADAFGKAAGRSLHEYRYELALVAIPAGACAGLIVELRQNPVTVIVVTVAVLVAARRPVGRVLAAARIRRRWDRAAKHCEIPSGVSVCGVDRIWSGYRLQARASHGASFDVFTPPVREALAASLSIRDVKVKRDEGNASRGELALITRDPLTEQEGARWPMLTSEEPPTLWNDFHIGVDEFGDEVQLNISQKPLLVGGIRGGGKSVMMSMPVAIAAMDKSVRMFLLDAKAGLEFTPWARCAERFAMNIEDGIETLTLVHGIMMDRASEMRERGISEGRVIRDLTPERGWPLIFVAIDELARFTDHRDKKLRDEFNGLLEEIIALGRAPGIVLIAATQKPEGSVVPTRIRDLFPYRLAFRCSTRQASDTILGSDMAGMGFNAQKISTKEKGVGYLLTEGSLPVRMRTPFVTDDDVFVLAERARQARLDTTPAEDAMPLRSVV